MSRLLEGGPLNIPGAAGRRKDVPPKNLKPNTRLIRIFLSSHQTG